MHIGQFNPSQWTFQSIKNLKTENQKHSTVSSNHSTPVNGNDFFGFGILKASFFTLYKK